MSLQEISDSEELPSNIEVVGANIGRGEAKARKGESVCWSSQRAAMDNS